MRLTADWPLKAACRDGDPDALFVEGAAQRTARRICQGCAVRYECLVEALDGRIGSGVWGGLTESERRALLRRYPNVVSWRRLFQAAG
jgi:WhiB family redox-sensing transcriptional regulator